MRTSIAVAELEDNTQAFISWYKLTKQKPASLSTLSKMDLPAGRGTKRTKSTQVRKGSVNSNKRAKTVVEGYIDHNSGPAVATTSLHSGVSHTQTGTQTQVSFYMYFSSMRPPQWCQLELTAAVCPAHQTMKEYISVS